MKRILWGLALIALSSMSAHAQAFISDGSDIVHVKAGSPVVMTMSMTMKMKDTQTKIGGLMTAVVPDNATDIVAAHEHGTDWRADLNIMRRGHSYMVFGTMWLGKPSMAHEDQPDRPPVPITIRDSFSLNGKPHVYVVKNTPVVINFDIIDQSSSEETASDDDTPKAKTKKSVHHKSDEDEE